MSPQVRMRRLAAAGVIPPLPSKSLRQQWEYLDDRVEPDTPADGEFRSHSEWVNKASSWIGFTGAKCFDAKGRRCRMGADFGRARDEDAFPVKFYSPSHFKKIAMPTTGQFAALKAMVSSYNPISIRELSAHPRAGRVTWAALENLLGEGAFEGGERRRLTERGRNDARFLFDCCRRASYVH